MEERSRIYWTLGLSLLIHSILLLTPSSPQPWGEKEEGEVLTLSFAPAAGGEAFLMGRARSGLRSRVVSIRPKVDPPSSSPVSPPVLSPGHEETITGLPVETGGEADRREAPPEEKEGVFPPGEAEGEDVHREEGGISALDPLSEGPAPAGGADGDEGAGIPSPTGDSGQEAEEDYSPPVLMRDAPPEYPLLARFNGWEGRVVLEFTVTVDGRVEEIRVIESSGHAVLDRAALEAAGQWEYLPARRRGEPVTVRMRRVIRFSLKEG